MPLITVLYSDWSDLCAISTHLHDKLSYLLFWKPTCHWLLQGWREVTAALRLTTGTQTQQQSCPKSNHLFFLSFQGHFRAKEVGNPCFSESRGTLLFRGFGQHFFIAREWLQADSGLDSSRNRSSSFQGHENLIYLVQIEVPSFANTRTCCLTKRQGAICHWYLYSQRCRVSLDSETYEGTGGERGCHLKHCLYQRIGDAMRTLNQLQFTLFQSSKKRATKIMTYNTYLSLIAPEQSKTMPSTTVGYPANEVRTTATLLECARLVQKISCTYFPLKPISILCWRLFCWILF